MDSTAARLMVAGGLAAGGIALCMSPTSSTSKAAGLTLAALKDPSLVKLLADQGLDPVRRSYRSSHSVIHRLMTCGYA
jgi:hypothetical protein|eukprot:COSAG02_NODE_235_length_27784_cov_9.895828_14_plen_78_part_00